VVADWLTLYSLDGRDMTLNRAGSIQGHRRMMAKTEPLARRHLTRGQRARRLLRFAGIFLRKRVFGDGLVCLWRATAVYPPSLAAAAGLLGGLVRRLLRRAVGPSRPPAEG
jgi:hypothetical protein